MTLRRTVPLAAAGVTAAAIAVIGAGPASAATPEPLCIGTTGYCAVPNGSYPVLMQNNGILAPAWLYNGPSHGPGQIQQNGTSLCMQLDHAAGNTVIEAACNGADYQSWQAIVVGGGWGFKSEYNSQCLTYNKGAGWLDTVPCVNQWYQEFYAY